MKKISDAFIVLLVLSVLLGVKGSDMSVGDDTPVFLEMSNRDAPLRYDFSKSENEISVDPLDEYASLKKLSYYDDALLERYISYKAENPELTDEKAVTYVNVGLDFPYYSEEIVSPAKNPETNLVLVNKYNYLPSDYEPSDLVSLAKDTVNGTIFLRSEAARAFEELSRGAKKAGYTIIGISGYRSWSYQSKLYNYYLKSDPKKVVDTYSARAGYSEHQTGLAIDVRDAKRPYNKFGKTSAYRWAVDNIHIYGFVIHYTEENKDITGYKNEPWHFRYIGTEAATELYNHNKNNPDDMLSVDEYIARKMSEPYFLETLNG